MNSTRFRMNALMTSCSKHWLLHSYWIHIEYIVHLWEIGHHKYFRIPRTICKFTKLSPVYMAFYQHFGSDITSVPYMFNWSCRHGATLTHAARRYPQRKHGTNIDFYVTSLTKCWWNTVYFLLIIFYQEVQSVGQFALTLWNLPADWSKE